MVGCSTRQGGKKMWKYARFWKLMKYKYHLRQRHLVMEIGTDSYLVDTDSLSFRLGYICPIFLWVIPHKAIKIELETWELSKHFLDKGKQEDVSGGRRKDRTVLITFILSRIARNMNFGSVLELNLSTSIMYLSLIIGIGLLIYKKIVISKKSNGVPKLMRQHLSNEVSFLLRPQSVLEAVKIILAFAIIILIMLFGFMLFSTIGSDPGTRSFWPGYILGLYWFNFLLYINLNILKVRHHFVKII